MPTNTGYSLKDVCLFIYLFIHTLNRVLLFYFSKQKKKKKKKKKKRKEKKSMHSSNFIVFERYICLKQSASITSVKWH